MGKKKPQEKRHLRINVTLPPAALEFLDALAEKENETRSELVTRALVLLKMFNENYKVKVETDLMGLFKRTFSEMGASKK